MNKVILIGRLTRDPELSQTPTGVAMAKFGLAVNRRFAKEGQQQTDFFNCIAWRQQGEFIYKYFKKGAMIAIVGSIQTRSWDGQDGKKQYATDIVVDEVYFTGSKADSVQAVQQNPQQATQPNFDEFDGFEPMDTGSDDDLPF